MTIHLLDLIDPRIDQYQQDIQMLQQQLSELSVREEELQEREQVLNSIDKSVWEKVEKKAAKKAKKQAHAEAGGSKGNTVNLAQRTDNTNEETSVNTAGMAGAGNAESAPIGTVLLLGAALLLCATTAIFYRKKNG